MPLISELGKQRQADLWELKEASKFYRASSRTARAIVRPCRYDLGIMFMIYLWYTYSSGSFSLGNRSHDKEVQCVCLYVCERDRDSTCVSVREIGEKETERHCVCTCVVCMCVCVHWLPLFVIRVSASMAGGPGRKWNILWLGCADQGLTHSWLRQRWSLDVPKLWWG